MTSTFAVGSPLDSSFESLGLGSEPGSFHAAEQLSTTTNNRKLARFMRPENLLRITFSCEFERSGKRTNALIGMQNPIAKISEAYTVKVHSRVGVLSSNGVGRPNCATKRKVAPAPGSLSTHIRPPIRDTSCEQMVSPSPVPPYFRVDDVSACENASKIVACLSSEIPMPVSATEKS